MDKRLVLKRFLDNGYNIDPEALGYLVENPDNIDFILNTVGDDHGTITMDVIKDVLKEQPKSGHVVFNEVPILDSLNNKISVSDWVSLRTEKYEKARNLIKDRLPSDVISINRVGNRKRFSLIVSVVERHGDSGALVEDPTGSFNVFFKDPQTSRDVFDGDIIGILCNVVDNDVVVSDVVWPGVSMRRGVSKTQKSTPCFFMSRGQTEVDITSDIKDIVVKKKPSVVFLLTENKVEHSIDKLKVVNTPTMFQHNGVNILICPWSYIEEYSDLWDNTEDLMVNLLKRMDLRPDICSYNSESMCEATFYDAIPDIFVTNSENNISSSYKGVTLLSIGDAGDGSIVWKIDLENREVNKVLFS